MKNTCLLDEIGIIHGELNNYSLLMTLWTFYAGWNSPLCIYYEELRGKTCLFILGLSDPALCFVLSRFITNSSLNLGSEQVHYISTSGKNRPLCHFFEDG